MLRYFDPLGKPVLRPRSGGLSVRLANPLLEQFMLSRSGPSKDSRARVPHIVMRVRARTRLNVCVVVVYFCNPFLFRLLFFGGFMTSPSYMLQIVRRKVLRTVC